MNKTTYVDFNQYKIVDKEDYYLLKKSGYDENGELLITKNLKTSIIRYRASNEYHEILLNIKKATYSITKKEYSLLLKNSNKKNAFFIMKSKGSLYGNRTLYIANREAYEELKHINKSIYGE